jgi:hypothetical protein
MKLEYSRRIFEKNTEISNHFFMQMDGQTDMAKLIVAILESRLAGTV